MNESLAAALEENLSQVVKLMNLVDKTLPFSEMVKECFVAIPTYVELLSHYKKIAGEADEMISSIVGETIEIIRAVITEIYERQPTLQGECYERSR